MWQTKLLESDRAVPKWILKMMFVVCLSSFVLIIYLGIYMAVMDKNNRCDLNEFDANWTQDPLMSKDFYMIEMEDPMIEMTKMEPQTKQMMHGNEGLQNAKFGLVLSKEMASAYGAKSRCAKKGMRLIEIDNEEVASNLRRLLTGENDKFWISGKQEDGEPSFIWGSGKVVDWKYWSLYNDLDSSVGTGCLTLEQFGWPWDLKYKIASVPCMWMKRYICQTSW